MIASNFNKQFKVLLWKNIILKIRRPLVTILEISIPISVAIVIMLIRNLQSNYNMDRCYLKEKQMDSLGPIPFLRDFVCTINTTCYSNSQIEWNVDNNSDFQTFINNLTTLTSVYNSLSKNNRSITDFNYWVNTFPAEIQQLSNSLTYMNNVITPILISIQMMSSTNSTEAEQGLQQLSSTVCGSQLNDVKMFMQYFLLTNNTRQKRSIASCKQKLYRIYMSSSTFGNHIYQTLAPFIFGKIYYTPNSSFTQELIKKANTSFVILDELRLTSIEWRLNFRFWLAQQLTNSSTSNNLRLVTSQCMQSSNKQLAENCRTINKFLNITSINAMIEQLTVLFALVEEVVSCIELNKFTPVESPDIIDQFTSGFLINVFGGIIFDPSFEYATKYNATLLNYTIRMSRHRIDSTSSFKVLDNFWTPIPRISTFFDMKYYTSGFLMLQESVDRAFIEMINGNQTVTIGSSMQIMPYPCYLVNGFIQFASNIMPFTFLISWAPIFSILVKSIVYEKEKRLKEFMLVMGLTHTVHWMAWFTVAMATVLIPNILIPLILRYRNILQYSSPGVICLLFFSYCVSFISQAFLISVFFNKANVAAVVAGLLYFLLYVPSLVFINMQGSIPSAAYFGAGLLAQVSFCNALNFIAYWEQATDGAQFGNLLDSSVLNLNFGVGHCIIMLWVDSVIYILITLYVEAVFPGQYGIPKPWYFFLMSHYWCPKRDVIQTIEDREPDTDNLDRFESVSSNLKVGISIRNLTKQFPAMKTPSVDQLNLDFYQSQITAFLGHNGAGKTTTISMLTGIFPPSSGTAYIFNEDIRTDIDSIRSVLGLCPQHNILFDHLTVKDHIYFYGLLKGMSSDDIKLSLPKIVEDVGLTKKMKTQANQLSGGMKRKLSVALAFIGDSKVIFLDEPTAGVDPFARRGIWDLLIKYKAPEKVIVLTTHHMDEADYLSDRIAIISRGKLTCCGSSVFLKRHFGDGYYLIFVKSEAAQLEGFGNDKCSISGEFVFKFVRKHVSNALIYDETTTQLTILLPANELGNNDFSKLFQNLDDSLGILNVTSYGLSDTSLEDVFLKVTDDPSRSEEQSEETTSATELLEGFTDDGVLPRPKTRQSFRDKSVVYKFSKFKHKTADNNINFVLLSGVILFLQQILALQIKKFHYTKRNIKGFFCELILPLVMVTMTVGILSSIDVFSNQPPMIIHPWLMMPSARSENLNTFYREENISNYIVNQLTQGYRSDVNEAGIRCMNRNVFKLPNYDCSPVTSNRWSSIPTGVIPMESPSCDCNATGFQLCSNLLSGGPPPSKRVMASTDVLKNLTGYNISDYLIKNFKTNAKNQYGGYQFLLPSNFGLACKAIGRNIIWNALRTEIQNSSSNQSYSESVKFVNHFQTFFQLSGIRTNFTRIWINTKGYASMSAYANVFDNLLLRSSLNYSDDSSKYGIIVSSHPFKYSQTDLLSLVSSQLYLQLTLAIFVILALSLIPASFVIFLIEERVCGSKRLQFVSGVNPYVYWISNFLGDILKYTISAFLIFLIFFAFNVQAFVGEKNIGVFVIILCLYGFVIIPHMYPFSFFISTPSAAFVVLSLYNMIIGSLTTTITFLLDGLQNNNVKILEINDLLKKIFLIFPQFDFGRSMMDISLMYLNYNISNGAKKYNPYDWNVTGEKLVALGALFVFWTLVVFLIESRIMTKFVGSINGRLNLNKHKVLYDEDSGVSVERQRVESQINKDVLKVMHLSKIYNPKAKCSSKCCKKSTADVFSEEKRKLAVNNISFGVKAGECFGLLGVNGAGKTTTFKMLTGEEMITNGEAIINGISITSDMVAAHKNMGFCPQVDALHAILTCEEELYFYCRIRGIRPSLIESTVESSFKSLSLGPYATKTTHSLSGGNKRKLSTAISLIGSPSVIFMDEPTSGMDAGARRFLWDRIQTLTAEQRAVVLTSHNMEECEVLSHRLAIMVNGQFQCLGSVQELKSKFGDDYYATVRLLTSELDSGDKIQCIIYEQFKNGVSLKDRNFVTMQFKIDPSKYKLHKIFDFFENLKTAKLIHDFSLSQATLDDIFINFAKSSNVVQTVDVTRDEENATDNCHENPCFEEDSILNPNFRVSML